MLQSKKIRA